MWPFSISLENLFTIEASANSQLHFGQLTLGKPEWTPWCVRAALSPGRDVMGRSREPYLTTRSSFVNL